jgi:hypothetical protein
MLYRAHAYVACHRSEETIIFEARPGVDPAERLRDLVAMVWQLPRSMVEHYNLHSESELRAMWAPAEDDAVLLQIGDGSDGPIYASPEHTQIITGPYWSCRLVNARAQADAHITRRRRSAVRKMLADLDPLRGVPRRTGQPEVARQSWEVAR